VGRLESRKGIIELGEAFAAVARNLPTATLWMAGSDNSIHDGFSQRMGSSYVDWLRKLWGPEIAGRVHFFGHVTEAAKNYLYSHCEVFVAPSRYESFGLILLEAMRFCKPVIATDVGGIPEIVKDGETGLLVPIESSERLAAAMTTLGADEVMRAQFGEAARIRFDEHFSLYRCGVRTERFYREVLAAWDGTSEYDLAPNGAEASSVSARAA
jgi:glycogen synthase